MPCRTVIFSCIAESFIFDFSSDLRREKAGEKRSSAAVLSERDEMFGGPGNFTSAQPTEILFGDRARSHDLLHRTATTNSIFSWDSVCPDPPPSRGIWHRLNSQRVRSRRDDSKRGGFLALGTSVMVTRNWPRHLALGTSAMVARNSHWRHRGHEELAPPKPQNC